MENGKQDIILKVQELSDLELAALLCFVAEQHCCIVEADGDQLDEVEGELQLMCQHTFGLQSASIHCTSTTSLDAFGQSLLVRPDSRKEEDSPLDYISHGNFESVSRRLGSPNRFDDRSSEGKIANVVIARDLNEAHEQVQIQALELIRGRRIFSRKEVHVAPKNLLVISLQRRESHRLMHHLNNHMFISHTHLPDDPLPHLLRQHDHHSDNASDGGSMSSVIRTPLGTPGGTFTYRQAFSGSFIGNKDIQTLVQRASNVCMSPDVRAYVHDITIFLRTHRAVASGVSALATQHLLELSRVLAPMHSLEFITPSLVALAVRKIYPHRLVLIAPERECSLQWGSNLETVKALLKDVTIEDVIEEVLSNVETPL